MALTGNTNEQKIWDYLKSKIKNDYGVAGLMGNLHAESGLRPENLQNTYEKSLGLSDAAYTKAVDNGTYTNFVQDKAGYGLAQWTYWSRKQNLLNFIKSRKVSIGDLEAQLDFLYKELSESYPSILHTLENATSVLQASNEVLLKFERPANQSEAVQKQRAQYGQTYYDKYATTSTTNSSKGDNNMSNSSLVNCVVKSPNHSGARTHKIDRISPHCVVGQLSAEAIGGCFTSSSRQASCNYGIGKDGKVVLVVDEANRSWCTSSNANDQRAVTIECASDATEPYAFNNAVYNKLIDLCVDICKRNGKKKLLWISDKNKALNYNPKSDEMVLTVHRWFANKSCPGNWMYARMGDLANKVNAKLGSGTVTTPSAPTTNKNYPAVPFTVKVIVSDLNIRKTPNGTVTGKYTGKGTFTIDQVQNGWGHLKSNAGWIYLENASYVTIGKTVAGSSSTAPSTKPAASSYLVKVTADSLNIRKGPGT
ncbi:MAG: phage tail tip lysozyme, partial [Acetobacter sp.]|nr:phage tail tip lysozyme [Acetobacter sp.]